MVPQAPLTVSAGELSTNENQKKKKKKGELALCTPYATGNQDLVSALRCNLL